MTKTYIQKPSEVTRAWHVIDVRDTVLGNAAVEIAKKLIGKQKKEYTPHVDGGDYVVVINAAEVAVTGKKESDKIYYRHSGFPGGLKQMTLGEMRASFPERIIEKAVYNMLPKNKLRTGRMARLRIYVGSEHPHQAQLGSAQVEVTPAVGVQKTEEKA
jgi:large subunit ribosomal protein L13